MTRGTFYTNKCNSFVNYTFNCHRYTILVPGCHNRYILLRINNEIGIHKVPVVKIETGRQHFVSMAASSGIKIFFICHFIKN